MAKKNSTKSFHNFYLHIEQVRYFQILDIHSRSQNLELDFQLCYFQKLVYLNRLNHVGKENQNKVKSVDIEVQCVFLDNHI